MLPDERHKRILNIINRQGNITVREMSTLFKISAMTAWRDLQALEDQGLIQRVRGGAVSDRTRQATEPKFELKESLFSEEKDRIARYAASRFVHDGDIVILEGGTTVACMVPHLSGTRVTILTNGMNSILKATPFLNTLTVMSCGGILRDVSHTFVGPQAEAFFAGFHASKLFLSATGFTLENGLTDPNPLEIQIKLAMIRAVDQVIVLMDSSKIGCTSLMPIIPNSEFDIFITDRGAPEEFLTRLRASGKEVHVVD